MIVVHANHLASLGHQVSLVTAVLDTVFTLDPRVAVRKLPSTKKLATILAALQTKIHCDLVVADIIPIACLLFLRNRGGVLYFAQDYDESYYLHSVQQGLIRCLYTLGLKLCRIPAVAVSHPLADLLKKRFAASVAVVENGVDAGLFYPDPDAQLISAKAKRMAVLLLSRADRRKGFDIAQDVVCRLTQAQADRIEIWTVGEPAAGLFPGLVHRDLGYLGEDALRLVMSSADALFYPTRHEGFPLMPLEAMACGCPVVTTTAVPYAVHADNALVSRIADREDLTCNLLALVDNRDLRAQLSAAGKAFARNHTLQAASQQFEAVLARLVPV